MACRVSAYQRSWNTTTIKRASAPAEPVYVPALHETQTVEEEPPAAREKGVGQGDQNLYAV